MTKYTKLNIIIRSVEEEIEKGHYQGLNTLPSLNDIGRKFKVSRDTAVRAYRNLQSRGLIISVPGKGFFTADNPTDFQKNVFLLFDELSPYKSVLLDAISRDFRKRRIGFSIYFHHYNPELFIKLVEDNKPRFTHFVLMPVPATPPIRRMFSNFPDAQLLLLDRHDGHKPTHRFCGQEFRTDIAAGLDQITGKCKIYRELIFIFPKRSFHPVELKSGFVNFCKRNKINHSIRDAGTVEHIEKGQAFLVIDDSDLVKIIRLANGKGLRPGHEVGIISYNESPLKEVISNGITTLSTDFEKMGENLARMIMQPKIRYIHNPFHLILRNSF
jgi:DNA-binding LacI/PurR family transcriptional regulator